jgi:hypothetical protein
MTKTKSFDQDGIFEIPRKLIHPDPDQPRVKVDDGLQASIDSEGSSRRSLCGRTPSSPTSG